MIHHQELKACIDACFVCAQSCEVFADECIELGDLEGLSGYIAIARECALVCRANAKLMSLGGTNSLALSEGCVALCNNCGDELEHLQQPVQARRCVNDCRACVDECRQVIHALQEHQT